jgi:WD40 repeat protein
VACTTLNDRPVAVTASRDSTVRVWDLAIRESTTVLHLHAYSRALAFASDGALVVGAGHEVMVLDHPETDTRLLGRQDTPPEEAFRLTMSFRAISAIMTYGVTTRNERIWGE